MGYISDDTRKVTTHRLIEMKQRGEKISMLTSYDYTMVFGTTPDTTYVFEDSFNGLKAGMASGATVIGLATTNSREDIAPLCHYVLDDFQGFTYDKLTQLHK